jgi:hypothetical protein
METFNAKCVISNKDVLIIYYFGDMSMGGFLLGCQKNVAARDILLI